MTAPRLRNIRLAIAAGLWLAAVTWFWWKQVQLSPDRVTAMNERVEGHGRTPDGTFSLTGWRHKDPVAKRGFERTGPVQIIDSKTGRVVREVLQPEDEIHTMTFRGEALAVLSRDGVVRIVDLVDERTRCTLEGRIEVTDAYFVSGGRILLVQTAEGLAGYEPETGVRRWFRPGLVDRMSGPDSNHVLAGPVVRPSRSVGNVLYVQKLGPSQLLSVLTGEADTRFGDATLMREVYTSPGGQYVAIGWKKTPQTIHDAVTGQLLWSLPPNSAPARFSKDGSRVESSVMTGKRSAVAVNWSIADGRVLEPAIYESHRGIGNGRYMIHGPGPIWIHENPKLSQWMMRHGLSKLVGQFENQQFQRFLFDTTTDRIVGRMPDHSWTCIDDDDHQGFTLLIPGYVVHYPLPPRRNWLWLIGWGLGPLAGIALLREAIRRRWARKDHLASKPRNPSPDAAPELVNA
jgi:hypothetical protein